MFKPFSVENPIVRSVPDGVIMPKKFVPMAEQIFNMEVRPDDIWIITYPKCGTTWTQVYLLYSTLKSSTYY